jgi:hypothetical protein
MLKNFVIKCKVYYLNFNDFLIYFLTYFYICLKNSIKYLIYCMIHQKESGILI